MDNYDIAILGGGPIGAATAYFLSLSPEFKSKKIILITQDPLEEDTNHESTYLYAGGCINYSFWPRNPLKAEMTKVTADFIKDLAKKGVDLSLIEDYYLFLDRGVFSPSLNVAGSKLVKYFIDQAKQNGVEYKPQTTLNSFEKQGDKYLVKTTGGEFLTEKAVLALGANNNKFTDKKIELEKRVLLVLDLPIDEAREKFPHTIIPFNDGWVYLFIKNIGGQLKMVLGEEDAVELDDLKGEENYLPELLEKGLDEIVPFLKEAKVEKILWGFDSLENDPIIDSEDNQLYVVNCGSAVRACIYIGQEVAKKILG